MSQVQFIDQVTDAIYLSKVDAGKTIDAVLSAFCGEIVAGKELRLNGFGIFTATERGARDSRNPLTGAAIRIAPSKVAKFPSAKALQDLRNCASQMEHPAYPEHVGVELYEPCTQEVAARSEAKI